MISIAMTNTGAGTVTPPAVGLCASTGAERVVRLAPLAGPFHGTGLPAGSWTPIRLRGRFATATATPAGEYAIALESVPTTALQALAVAGVPAEQPSSTPGDLPPEDPLS